MTMIPLTRSLTISATEPEAIANTMLLGEHQTTGLLPVGFEFEHGGARYDHFDLSTDGFIRFSSGSCRGGVGACLPLEAAGGIRLGEGRVAYEIRGSAPRRRLVLSFADLRLLQATLQLVLYERTGMIQVGRVAQSLGDPTIRQLDKVQPSSLRANSARKIG
jgi:hypothetical protein